MENILQNNKVMAMDFCTVAVEITKDIFQPKYIWILIEHKTRKIAGYNLTFNPSENWVIQQFRNIFPTKEDEKYIVHDRDTIFMNRVDQVLPEYFNITPCPTAPGSPWQNPYAESFFATLRRELLNHMIFRDEGKLRSCLSEYIDFYNNHRMHSGIMEAPNGGTIKQRPAKAKLKSKPVLNGLHHIYYWEDSNSSPTSFLQRAA